MHVLGEIEYVVTVKEGVDWEEVHRDLINWTARDPNVDSSIVPDRSVEIANLRPVNKRNTHYYLTKQEKDKLKLDPRIEDVKRVAHIPPPTLRAYQDTIFDKNSNSTGSQSSWALLRHISETNNYGTSFSDPGGTYDYVLDGTGVDVVIQDTGVEPNHPEWENTGGTSRLKQVDWFNISGVAGTMPANHYSDIHGHGTHCSGTVAGKTFGWARNADIYIQAVLDNSSALAIPTAMDTLLAWHNKKNDPNDAAYTGRPTVVNQSWGYVIYLNTTDTPNVIQFGRGVDSGYFLTGGSYRGVTHTETTRANLRQYGINGEYQGQFNSKQVYGYPSRVISTDADIKQLADAGIVVCMAAGNDYMKVDVPGGVDWDNYLEFTADNSLYYRWYYHRGGSPSLLSGLTNYVANPVISYAEGFNVGAVDTATQEVQYPGDPSFYYLDRKANFSQSGPGVNIYCVGTAVMSASSNTNVIGGVSYYNDFNYRQIKINGTSMASPNMAGMVALLQQAHPDWSPAQIVKYFETNAKEVMYDTGSTNDYTVANSVHGGIPRIAYFPLSGQRPFKLNEE